MSYRIAMIGLSLLGAAGLGAWGYKLSENPQRAAAASARAEPVAAPAARTGYDAAALSEVVRMRSEVAQLRADMQDLRGAAEPTDKPSDEQPASEGLTPEEGRAQADARWREHMAAVATAFEQERPDTPWANDTQHVVEGALAQANGLKTLGHVECRAVTCRVEVADNDAEVSAKQLPMFLNNIGKTLPNAELSHTVTPQGKTYTVYLSDAHRQAEATR